MLSKSLAASKSSAFIDCCPLLCSAPFWGHPGVLPAAPPAGNEVLPSDAAAEPPKDLLALKLAAALKLPFTLLLEIEAGVRAPRAAAKLDALLPLATEEAVRAAAVEAAAPRPRRGGIRKLLLATLPSRASSGCASSASSVAVCRRTKSASAEYSLLKLLPAPAAATRAATGLPGLPAATVWSAACACSGWERRRAARVSAGLAPLRRRSVEAPCRCGWRMVAVSPWCWHRW